MLVRAKIIDDAGTFVAVEHVGVEAALPAGAKRPDPSDGFPAKRIDVCIILDLKRDVSAAFREHDSAPCPKVEKRQGVSVAVPDLFHYPGSDGGQIVFTGEAEAALNLRVQPSKIRAHRTFVDGFHGAPIDGRRRQRAALGICTAAKKPVIERPIIAKFKVTGLNAANKKCGDSTATFTNAASIARILNTKNDAFRQVSMAATATPI